MEEKKKKKQEQSAEWRNKVQRELAGMNIEKHETERKEIKDIEQKSENKTVQNKIHGNVRKLVRIQQNRKHMVKR